MKYIALLAMLIAVAGSVSAARARAPQRLPSPAVEPPAPSVRPSLLFQAETATPQTVQAPRGAHPGPLRDPTEPSPAVRKAIEESQALRKPAGAAGGPAPTAQQGIAQINLKARLIGRRTPPIAVLEINGSNYLVYADTNLALTGASQGLEIKVLELSAQQVRVEVLPIKKVFVLH